MIDMYNIYDIYVILFKLQNKIIKAKILDETNICVVFLFESIEVKLMISASLLSLLIRLFQLKSLNNRRKYS